MMMMHEIDDSNGNSPASKSTAATQPHTKQITKPRVFRDTVFLKHGIFFSLCSLVPVAFSLLSAFLSPPYVELRGFFSLWTRVWLLFSIFGPLFPALES